MFVIKLSARFSTTQQLPKKNVEKRHHDDEAMFRIEFT